MKFFSKNKTKKSKAKYHNQTQQTLLIKSSIGSHHQEEQTQYNHQHRHNIFQWLISALLDCKHLKIPICSQSNQSAYINPGRISIKLEHPTAPIIPIITSKLPKKIARAVRMVTMITVITIDSPIASSYFYLLSIYKPFSWVLQRSELLVVESKLSP